MGAGKSTLAREVALRLGRVGSDLDAMIEHAAGDDIHSFFVKRGEAEFRRLEENETLFVFWASEPDVFALGGGAVLSEAVRDRLREHAFTVWVDVDVDTAWERVRGSDRPLAQDEQQFRALYEERLPLYEAVADAPLALVADSHVAGIHGAAAQLALGSALAEAHELPAGEDAKTLEVCER